MFEDLRKFLASIPCINRGGCGFAALAMYDAAIKEGKTPTLMISYHDEHTMQQNERAMNGQGDPSMGLSHVFLALNGRYIDCMSNAVDLEERYYHPATREFVAKILEIQRWNPDFNRIKHVPRIYKYIGYNLLTGEKEKGLVVSMEDYNFSEVLERERHSQPYLLDYL